ncbi:MAG TPA: hypothetical protein ENJ82_14355 [Bacteroidetes bacterium]|nr:hypothetical protein [Bacteroidota bacterium]
MRRIGLFFVLISVFSSCQLFDREEEVPAFFQFRNPRVILDETTGFSTNTGIRDIWLYQAGFLQGTYPVNPVIDSAWTTVPVKQLGKSRYFMEGGVHESGVSTLHLPYTFWDRVTFNLVGTAGDTSIIDPVFHYLDDQRFTAPVNEKFEGGLVDLIPFNKSLSEPDSTFIRPSNIDPFQGNASGYIHFGPDDRWFEAINSTSFKLDRSKDTWLEITYRSNIKFEAGFVYQNTTGFGNASIVTVAPRTKWNTIYIHLIGQLREIINAGGTNTDFWMWLFADGEGNDGYIYFDNIRLLYVN